MHVHGGELNAASFGACLRLRQGERTGSWRELHGGAGYWSVDSPITVLARKEGEAKVEVRWPGGALRTYAVPANAAEVQVEPDGRLAVVRSF